MDSRFTPLDDTTWSCNRRKKYSHAMYWGERHTLRSSARHRSAAAIAGANRYGCATTARLVVDMEGWKCCAQFDLCTFGMVPLHRRVLRYAAKHTLFQSRTSGGEYGCGGLEWDNRHFYRSIPNIEDDTQMVVDRSLQCGGRTYCVSRLAGASKS